MPEDQTTQNTEPEVTQTPDPAATDSQPQTGGTEPTTQDTESIDWQARHTEASRKITEQGQELKNLRAAREAEQQQMAQYQNALAALGTQQQANVNPKDAAFQQYQEHLYSGDTDAANRAFQHWDQLRSQEIAQQAQQAAMQQHQLMESMRKAQQLSGVQDQTALAAQLQPITGNLMADDLLVVKAYREGNLGAIAAKLNAQQEEERQRAELLKALPGMGGGKGVPGQTQPAQIPIPFEEWAQLNDGAKRRLLEADESYVITGSPDGWKPETIEELTR